ncbi:hypothetical protein [Burkholderia glumae]|uniref:Uncharacterized protein n=2 Tax=Burkholderia glumae TaxID=337 RepID=A0AAQ0BRQ9_BURGL|nr:hypothetical protein [Burkholderia glumae]AJY63894.1 hypothetical protein KS03_5388 [Burkholderia glumae LMG 2196 = ATCC 33617]MCM2483716.1 hypothetical protein [Burkholderia glumae]MCM2509410.1 hypothetical protein [Burkholderia glumae]MCM2541487.1 hypothetical protein [Burkholderia glumae]MCM2550821.1 hypothetical protein [Burkholderia glumae]
MRIFVQHFKERRNHTMRPARRQRANICRSERKTCGCEANHRAAGAPRHWGASGDEQEKLAHTLENASTSLLHCIDIIRLEMNLAASRCDRPVRHTSRAPAMRRWRAGWRGRHSPCDFVAKSSKGIPMNNALSNVSRGRFEAAMARWLRQQDAAPSFTRDRAGCGLQQAARAARHGGIRAHAAIAATLLVETKPVRARAPLFRRQTERPAAPDIRPAAARRAS